MAISPQNLGYSLPIYRLNGLTSRFTSIVRKHSSLSGGLRVSVNPYKRNPMKKIQDKRLRKPLLEDN
ncbi:hypothetical protein KIN20_015114 [Parelaphostrongylus tenuis]|uniref:Uncharacterized protein n=1 Tax=Parelaphostrongylus tenuis TaxID=148309 RepID=A0AAD5MWU1_PARTN|nr:hypothetical protein KIN20_015114 [Parelaphostrongylus tenuis]